MEKRGLRRRPGRRNIGDGPLEWQSCRRCGTDVLAPADLSTICDRCVLRAAIRAKHEEEEE